MFEISNSITFAGYILSQDGIRPDPAKIKAIVNFPPPKDISGIWSFLGMTNQIGHFIPNFGITIWSFMSFVEKECSIPMASRAWKLIQLHKKRHYRDPFHSNTTTPKLNTYLVTDASKLNGLGYALIQSSTSPTKPESIIQCGSRVLTSHECNYATVEFECLAMAWAVTKCDFFLRGCLHFKNCNGSLSITWNFL